MPNPLNLLRLELRIATLATIFYVAALLLFHSWIVESPDIQTEPPRPSPIQRDR